MDKCLDLLVHTSFRYTLSLRLAIFYDAPLAELEEIVEAGRRYAAGCADLVYGPDWALWTGIVASRSGKNQADYDSAVKELSSPTSKVKMKSRS